MPANPWRPTLKRRLAVAATALILWSVAIEARLVYLQIVQRDELAARAARQQSQTVETPAKRGDILDRHGRMLAYTVDAETVYAVPTEINDAGRTAAALCGALADCSVTERQALAERIRKGRHFVYVRRQISPEQARRIAALELDGVDFIKEHRRFYPNKHLASHLLGYVGIDNAGLNGIEGTYDRLIKGEAGKVLVQTDARRHAFSRVEKPPTAGASLELTIDKYLQHVAERELRAGVVGAGAAGGSAVVMDPMTGEILALANYPTFNPNAYNEFDDDDRRNRAIQDLYEPGSTFKIVTAGAALEENVVTPDTLVETGPGRIRFGSQVIDEDKGHNYGTLSFRDVIVRSSNVGSIKVGLRIGAGRMSDYVQRFGFGRPLSPDFRGESPGIVWASSRLTDRALASVSMGYQIGVTPLQMASAVSVVANGGELLQPRAVRTVIRGGTRIPVPRKSLGRAINAGVAAELTAIMESVVVDGTGKNAQVAGYTIAGKTGTANKVVNRRYSNTDFNVSFVGFAPSRQPQFTIVVVVDSPRAPGVSPYGGAVAAPIFQKIAEAALRHRGVPPSINAPSPVLVARRDEAQAWPTSGPIRPPAVVEAAGTSGSSEPVFPDLVGMSARDAVRRLARLGLTARLHGAGRVLDQRPAGGTPMDSGLTATLWLGRRPPIDAASATNP
jgi:cell division protein FtsI (penicillin-binding protein 3)